MEPTTNNSADSAEPVELLWELREQAEVSQGRSTIAACPMDTSIITRGFEAVVFGIDPADPTAGTRWVSYDTAQQKITTLIDDVNDACGQIQSAGKLGHRVTACVHVDVLGTGPAPGAGRFLGGQVLRNGASIGKLPAGWRVIRFDPCWPLANIYMDPDPLDAIALACDPDGKRHQLFHVMSDAIRPMTVTGGPELNRFFAWQEHVIYPDGKGRVFRSRISPGGRAEPVTDAGLIARVSADYTPLCRGTSGQFGGFRQLPRTNYMLLPDGSLEAFVSPEEPQIGLVSAGVIATRLNDVTSSTADQWGRSELCRWFLEKGRQPGDPLPSEPAAIFFARQGVWPVKPATIHLLIPGESPEPIELGPLQDSHDRVWHTVHQLRVMPSGEVAVVAGSRSAGLIVQVYANPMLERFTQQLANHIDRVVARTKWPQTHAHTITSLYEYGEHHDRGYDCAAVVSDGSIHFGSMPHHPTLGASVFRFDPRTEDTVGVELLGDFDRLAGNLGAGDIPSMIHTRPVQVRRRLIWAGQDPFYGVHDFPGMTPLTHRYRGSPVLNYDLETRRFELMGTPLPGRESIFELHANAVGDQLYFREGYDSSRWYKQHIDQRYRFDGPPEPLSLVDGIHVNQCSNGKLAYVTPERNHWPEDDHPPAMLRIFDPGKNETQDVAMINTRSLGVGGDDRWSIIHDMRPDDSALLVNDAGAIIGVDLATGRARAVAASLESQDIAGPGALSSQITLHDAANDRVIAFRSVMRPFVLVSVCITQLSSGKTQHLGVLRDQFDRPMQAVTFAVLHEGVVYYSGFSWGHSNDAYYMRRQAFSYVARVDTVFGKWAVPPKK